MKNIKNLLASAVILATVANAQSPLKIESLVADIKKKCLAKVLEILEKVVPRDPCEPCPQSKQVELRDFQDQIVSLSMVREMIQTFTLANFEINSTVSHKVLHQNASSGSFQNLWKSNSKMLKQNTKKVGGVQQCDEKTKNIRAINAEKIAMQNELNMIDSLSRLQL
jgi:hypothetical protein